MACPYFQPSGPFADPNWLQPPRLPLGAAYRGVCRAHDGLYEPTPDQLRSFCNTGYARSCCDRFPADAECDAMRYSLAADNAGLIEIQYIAEKDHGPLRHGRAAYDSSTSHLTGLDGIPAAQARAFIDSYLRRKKAAAKGSGLP